MNDRPVRVVRLLVYTYASAERMVQDMASWGVGAGATRHAPDIQVRSATLSPEFIEPDPSDIVRKRGKVELIIAEAKAALDEFAPMLYRAEPEQEAKMALLRRAIDTYEADT